MGFTNPTYARKIYLMTEESIHHIESQELYCGHGWKLTLDSTPLPNGKIMQMARVKYFDSVHIVASPSPKHVLLLREYRPIYGEHIWMLPSGRVDKEIDFHSAAQRELREETGYSADTIRYIGASNHAEGINYACHLFFANSLRKDPLPQDDSEFIECHDVALDDAITKVLGSPYVHTMSAYGLLRYAREHGL